MVDLIRRERGFSNGEAFAWLHSELGIGEAPKQADTRYVVTGRWVYRDRDGQPLYRVVRRDCPGKPERIHQERYDPATSSYVSGKGAMKGVRLVPYRLPDWLAEDGPVLIPEGEKKVDALLGLGFLATCSPGGAGKWSCGFGLQYLSDRDVILLPDNDPINPKTGRRAGRDHVADVAAYLQPVAASLKILELPGLNEKGDVVDWLDAGGTAEQLRALVDQAPDAAGVIARWQADEKPGKAAAPAVGSQIQRGFKLAERGVYHEVDKEGNVEWIWIASPIEVLAETRNAAGEAWGDSSGFPIATAWITSARGSCGALLLLDEIGQAEPWDIDAMAYLIGNEAGKGRMKRDATARETLMWRTLFLSTGEVGLQAKLSEIGRRPRAEQAMRLIEIPADAGAGLGAFERLHGASDGDALARRLKLASKDHWGHAARAPSSRSPRRLPRSGVAGPRLTSGAIRTAKYDGLPAGSPCSRLRASSPRCGASCRGRRARRTAPPRPACRHGSPRVAARSRMKSSKGWRRARRSSSNTVPTASSAHGMCGATRTGHEILDRVIKRAGFRRLNDEGEVEYFVLPEAWKREVRKGFDHVALARAMCERGWMQREGKDLTRKTRVPRHGLIRVHHVLPGALA